MLLHFYSFLKLKVLKYRSISPICYNELWYGGKVMQLRLSDSTLVGSNSKIISYFLMPVFQQYFQMWTRFDPQTRYHYWMRTRMYRWPRLPRRLCLWTTKMCWSTWPLWSHPLRSWSYLHRWTQRKPYLPMRTRFDPQPRHHYWLQTRMCHWPWLWSPWLRLWKPKVRIIIWVDKKQLFSDIVLHSPTG